MTNLYCARCGTPTVPGERFCGECGNDLTIPGSVTNAPPLRQGIPPTTPVYPSVPPAAPVQQQGYWSSTSVTTRRRSPLPLIIGLVLLLAALGVGGYFLLFNKGGGNNNQAVVSSTSTPAIAASSPTSVISVPISDTQVVAAVRSDTPVLTVATPPIAATTAPANSGSPADPALVSELNDAVKGMQGLTSYHAQVSGSYQSSDLQIDGDFSKDASQFTFTQAGNTKNAIFVGGKSYVSTDNGQSWQEDSSLDSIKVLTSIFDNANFGSSSGYTDLGNETLTDGSSAHKVKVREVSGREDTLWIVDDGGTKTIHRLEEVSTGATPYDLIVNYSNFNAPLNITAPKVGG